MREVHATREYDPDVFPDIRVFKLTGTECAELDEELDSMEESYIAGGWFYELRFPGCEPHLEALGPYPTREAAEDAAIEEIRA